MSHRARFGNGFIATKHSEIRTWPRCVVGIVLGDGVSDSAFSLNESIKSYPFIGDTDDVFKIGDGQ